MATVKAVVTGIGRIDRKLAQLPVKIRKKVVRQSIRGGMKLVLASARADVPVDTGLTRANVVLKATRRKAGRIGMNVLVRSAPGLVKATGAGKRYFYPAVVEYGSRDRAANPWMHRVFNRRADPARRQTIRLLEAGLDREIST